METTEGIEFYKRLLNERLNQFKESQGKLLNQIQRENREQKVEAAREVQSRIRALRDGLAAPDVPDWLKRISTVVDQYIVGNPNDPNLGYQLLNVLMDNNYEVKNHKWQFTEPTLKGAVDFSGIYQQAYLASRIPALFEELIAQIQSIIDSGALDSLQAIRRLETLIATLKKNLKGDYLASVGAWKFGKTFLTNLCLEGLESIPVAKQITKAVRKTMSDLDLEFKHVVDAFNTRIREQLPEELPPLLDQQQPLLLPPPAEPDVIDAEFTDATVEKK